MNIVITMAGSGARFREVGITTPKFMIKVGKRSLFEWAMLSLRQFYHGNFIFVTRSEHQAESFVTARSAEMGLEKFSVLSLSEPTAGQADTVLAAAPAISNWEEEFLIYNIDTFVQPEQLSPSLIRGSGWLPCFSAPGEHWSFVRFDEHLQVTEVREKVRISEFATVGLYYFSSYRLFKEAYERTDYSAYRERFVAPIYSALLANPDTPVFTSVLNPTQVHALGTPAEVEGFSLLLTQRGELYP